MLVKEDKITAVVCDECGKHVPIESIDEVLKTGWTEWDNFHTCPRCLRLVRSPSNALKTVLCR